MRSLIAPIIVVPLVLGSLPVLAQGNPSADQIINSLRPSGNLVLGGTRGIRLAPAGGAASATPSPTQQPHCLQSASDRSRVIRSRSQQWPGGQSHGQFRGWLRRSDT